MIDQDLAHETCGNADEVRAVLPPGGGAVGQPEKHLVDERGGLERVAVSLATHR